MPVACVCEHCGRTFRVSSRFSAQRIGCPHCKKPTRVPAPDEDASCSRALKHPASNKAVSNLALLNAPLADNSPSAVRSPGGQPSPDATPTESSVSAPPSALPGEQSPGEAVAPAGVPVTTEPPAWLVPAPAEKGAASRLPNTATGLWMPVASVVMQGVLLAMTAASGLLVGWLLGHRSVNPMAVEPCIVWGTVSRADQADRRLPDTALVLLLPEGERLVAAERLAVEELWAEDLSAGEHAVRKKLRQVGGDVCRADSRGFYCLKAHRRGRYHILCLATGVRQAAQTLDRSMLAEIGKFVDQPHQLIGARSYHWQSLVLDGDRTLDILLQP